MQRYNLSVNPMTTNLFLFRLLLHFYKANIFKNLRVHLFIIEFAKVQIFN